MNTALKTRLARLSLRCTAPSLLADSDPFNVLLGRAIQLQLGMLAEETFRGQLDHFYQTLDRQHLAQQIDLEAKIAKLDGPKGYKVGISNLRDESTPSPWRPGLRLVWRRRMGLLNRIGVRSDILILRKGEDVPPHGHYRVVSGFYVLQGEVAIRHYDRVREEGDSVMVRPAVARILGPGGYTTNSEYHHNIHWLRGIADRSYLFRVTVSGTPVKTFGGHDQGHERVYIDPTGKADDNGLILAPYIDEKRAKELYFPPVESAADPAAQADAAAQISV